MYRCIKHRKNGIFKTAMTTSHVSDKIADVPTKCRRQMMYLMFTMVNSNMVWIFLQIWISWYQCTSYVYKNIQCKQRTDISLKKLMFFFSVERVNLSTSQAKCTKILHSSLYFELISWFLQYLIIIRHQMSIGLFIGIKIVAFKKSDHKIIKGGLTAHLPLLVISYKSVRFGCTVWYCATSKTS